MRLLSGTTLIITNCTLQFDAGVSIICEPGSYMQVVNATLTNSTTTAWRGIRLIGNPVNTFGSGATCELHGATIRNSYTGIEAAMGSTVSSVYSLFDANVVGIELGTGGIWNAISFTIAETRFTSSTNLIAQCSTLPIQGLTKPLAGIIAKNIGTLDMTPFVSPSTVAFDNLNNGIVSTRGNCIVNNCKFEEIRNYDMHSFNYKGCGVYANGGSSNFLIVQGQQNNNIPVDFYSCDIGVEFNNIMPTVTNCNMNDIFQYGVLGHRAFGLLTVNANNINSFNHGVFINDVTQVQGAFIDANSIILNVLIGAPSNGEAIHLAALALNNNYMEIAENDIVMHNGVAGIRCIGISSNVNNNGTVYVHHIHKNGISMDHTLKSSIGIDIVKCEAIRVTCNNIISTILGPTLFHQGINMTACPTAQIGCNKMTNTYYGLAVHGSNSGSLIRENHFRNHQTGLLYDANVTVGQQLFAGNTWAVPSVLDALNINSAFLNEYYYNGIGTLYEPITVIPPLGWFIQQQGIDPSDCPEDTLVNLPFVCPSFITGDTIDLEFAEKIATNQYVTSEFQEGILEKEKEILYNKIENDLIAANASTAIQNFYNNNATTKYNKYNEIVDNLNALGSVNSLINGEALNYMASLLTELINARSLFSTLNLNSTSIEIHNAILLYTNNLNNGIFSNKPDAQIAASLMFQKQTAINDIIDVINSITENDVFASNRKDALRIVIKIFENEEIVLNQNEIDFVNSLAFDCPYIKGDGVFIAQAIYNLINPAPANFDNTAQCAVFGVTYKSTLNANGLDENVQQDLNVFQNFENVKSIEVYDLAGKLVAISNSKNSNFIKQHLKENNFYIIKHTSITNVVTYSRLFYIER